MNDNPPTVIEYGQPSPGRQRPSTVWAVAWGGAVGICLAIPALFVAAVSAGGGHGHYVAARALFPFTFLGTGGTDGITPPLIAVALAQFPAYGAACGWATSRGRPAQTILWIGAAHAVAAAFCFIVPMPNFD